MMLKYVIFDKKMNIYMIARNIAPDKGGLNLPRKPLWKA